MKIVKGGTELQAQNYLEMKKEVYTFIISMQRWNYGNEQTNSCCDPTISGNYEVGID